MKTISNKWINLALGLALFSPTLSWGQATSSVTIVPTNQNLKRQVDGSSQLDLLAELKKAKPALASQVIEIQMLRFQAKANVGGAQAFLKLNNQFVASAVIETDPDLFATEDRGYVLVELRNIERARISSAILHIQNASNVKMKAIEVTLGAVQEPVIFGRYAQEQADVIGASGLDDDRDMRPSSQAVAAIYGTYYAQEEARIVAAPVELDVPQAQPRAQAQPQAQARTAAPDSRDQVATQLRSAFRAGIISAESGDLRNAERYLDQARTYYRNEKSRVAPGQKIFLEEEVLAYISRLEIIYNGKQTANRRQSVERPRQQVQPQVQPQPQAGPQRPQVNTRAREKCVKARKKKIGNKKEFCIGEYIAGVWPQHNPPQIIDVDTRAKNIILLFDYTNEPLIMSVDELPDQR